MNYSKPEVNVLGEATRVIQFHLKGRPNVIDSFLDPRTHNAAYDLDE